MSPNLWLIAGGTLSAIAAALHVCIIFGGPAWYRFFHAGPRLTRLAEAGALEPTLVTLGIATILAIWAAYGFSGAGLIPRLPLMRPALVAISAIYLLRAFALVPWLIFTPRYVDGFIVWSSFVVLVFGVTYAMGTWTSWAKL
jgi:hypothetical protein